MDLYLMRLVLTPWWVYAGMLLAIPGLFIAGRIFLARRNKLSQWKSFSALFSVVAIMQLMSIPAIGCGLGERMIGHLLEEHGVEATATITAISERVGFRAGPVHPLRRSALIWYTFSDQNGVSRTAGDSEMYAPENPLPWHSGAQIKIVYDPAEPTHTRIADYVERARKETRRDETSFLSQEVASVGLFWLFPFLLLCKQPKSKAQLVKKIEKYYPKQG